MSWYEELDQKMADYLPDVPVLREEPLSRHTSFRIGGPARRMAFPKSGEQLVLLVSFARACGAGRLSSATGRICSSATGRRTDLSSARATLRSCAGAGVKTRLSPGRACRSRGWRSLPSRRG